MRNYQLQITNYKCLTLTRPRWGICLLIGSGLAKVCSPMNVRAIWGLIKTAGGAWVRDNAPRLGAALSYYTIFSIAPLFIIVIFVASLFLNASSVRNALFEQVGGMLGRQSAVAIQSSLSAWAPAAQGVIATVLAIATLIASATGLFIELQSDLNTIWGVEEKSGQGLLGFIKNRLLSFAMVVAIGFLLLVSLVLSAALAGFAKYLNALVPGLHILSLGLHAIVSLAVITVLFAMIFKVLPDVKIAWRDVWIGAAMTSLLFTAGKFALGFYLGRSSTVSAYGAAGSVVLILLWVYYSAQILFFGAELTQAYANRYGAHLEPKPNAQWVPAYQLLMMKQDIKSKPKPVKKSPALARQEQLLSELKQEIESLRTRVKQQTV